ncbi:MAG: hypothetical protein ABMA01_24390, partial [Chthoniobacteraceae bacterium]
MKKSIWIFLLAVLVPGAVLGWLALRSAEEQQIIFERRTAELYQKETETLAATVRNAVEGERRAFADTVHRLLANGDPDALARDFANTLADAWPRKAIGFSLDGQGKLLSPSVTDAARDARCRSFLMDNGSFLSGLEPATVYAVQTEGKQSGSIAPSRMKSSGNVSQNFRFEEPRSKSDAPAPEALPLQAVAKDKGTVALHDVAPSDPDGFGTAAAGKTAKGEVQKRMAERLLERTPAPVPAKAAAPAPRAAAARDARTRE